ncbi:hypothetical protein [Poriferisphaera sp. WC338]|uniref:hypothetical protein n=1 Tax=Poriferisphaera sp. WC338 TaxID=3425129 RepID=UPI003D816230
MSENHNNQKHDNKHAQLSAYEAMLDPELFAFLTGWLEKNVHDLNVQSQSDAITLPKEIESYLTQAAPRELIVLLIKTLIQIRKPT